MVYEIEDAPRGAARGPVQYLDQRLNGLQRGGLLCHVRARGVLRGAQQFLIRAAESNSVGSTTLMSALATTPLVLTMSSVGEIFAKRAVITSTISCNPSASAEDAKRPVLSSTLVFSSAASTRRCFER